MKKALSFAIILLIFVLTLSACGEADQPLNSTHVHNFGYWATVKEATCTEIGEKERHCYCGEKETQTIDALGHCEMTISEIPASCTADGKTEGKRCLLCNKLLVAQTVLDKLGHNFGDWIITKPATNSQEGERMHICSVCNVTEYDVIDILPYEDSLGSAKKISDTTVIVSIFANDLETSWDFGTNKDKETISIMHEHLSSAVDWLEENCKAYNVYTDFVYDWNIHSDLFYTFDFGDINMVRSDGGGYKTQRTYIRDHIDSEKLKQKYNAQNILYILYFNTDEDNTVNSWSLSDRQNCDVEVINAFARDNYSTTWYYLPASSFAHEILHCFGAYDLYYASDAISKEYVDHCNKTNSQDIMYTVSFGKEITMEFSELCAYYVGLTDSCDDVEKWNLAQSTHIAK